MHEGGKYGEELWLWMRIKYKSTAKLDLLRVFYAEKIILLKLGSKVSLHNYIKRSKVWNFCGDKLIQQCSRSIGSLLKWLNR